MTIALRKQTNSYIVVGPLQSVSSPHSELTSLVFAAGDIEIEKANAFSGSNDGFVPLTSTAPIVINLGGGFYAVQLTETDLNQVGLLTVRINHASAKVVSYQYQVLTQEIYDGLYGTNYAMPADVVKVRGNEVTSEQATNWGTFWQNDGNVTSRVVDDVGSGAGGDPIQITPAMLRSTIRSGT